MFDFLFIRGICAVSNLSVYVCFELFKKHFTPHFRANLSSYELIVSYIKYRQIIDVLHIVSTVLRNTIFKTGTAQMPLIHSVLDKNEEL